jgi:hypothetical protein
LFYCKKAFEICKRTQFIKINLLFAENFAICYFISSIKLDSIPLFHFYNAKIVAVMVKLISKCFFLEGWERENVAKLSFAVNSFWRVATCMKNYLS